MTSPKRPVTSFVPFDESSQQTTTDVNIVEMAIHRSIGLLSINVFDDTTADVAPEDSMKLDDSTIALMKTYVLSRLLGHPHEPRLTSEVESRFSAFIHERNSRNLLELQQVFWWARKFHKTPVTDLFAEYTRGHAAQRQAWCRSKGRNGQCISRVDRSSFRTRSVLRESMLPCFSTGKKVGVPPYNYRVAPSLQEDVVRVLLTALAQQPISFLLPDGRILPLLMANPIPLPSCITSSYRCDTCANYPSYVAFQSSAGANAHETPADVTCLSSITMCLPCAVHFVYESFAKMKAALSPPKYVPFNDGECRMNVWSAVYEGNTVWMSVELEPINLYLCVWQLQEGLLMDQLPFAEQLSSVAVPTGTWREQATIVSLHNGKKQYDPTAVCPICLEPFNSLDLNNENSVFSAVMKTSCQHWFHTQCLVDLRCASSSSGVCPICRNKNYIPNSSTSEAYEVKLTLAQSPRCMRPPVVRVAVAALLGEEYINPTSVVACRVLNLRCGEEFNDREKDSSCSPM